MPVIVVANPKGGVGKSTLATNIAGLYARQGRGVMLGDVDRQQSSRQWLALRPQAAPRIEGWDLVGETTFKPPKGVTHMVLDTPAGLHGKLLDAVMRVAERIVIPLQPSLFDIQATHDFVNRLREHKRRDDVKIGGLPLRQLRALARREVLELAAEFSPSPLAGEGESRPRAFNLAPDAYSPPARPRPVHAD